MYIWNRSHSRLETATAILFAALAMMLAPPLKADVTYSYQGNLLTPNPSNSVNYCSNPECSIQGDFTIADALNSDLSMVTISPLSFRFQFGSSPAFEFDQTNISCPTCTQSFQFSTDANGNISQWNLDLANSEAVDQFLIRSGIGDLVGADSLLDTWSSSIPGRWAETPEPSAAILVATLCGGLFLLRRNRSRVSLVQPRRLQ